MELIFEKSVAGRRGIRVPLPADSDRAAIDPDLRRARPAELPECAESEVVRHFTNLSRRNFSVDTHFYPLGSCTMKHNPRACEKAAALPGFAGLHPILPQLNDGHEFCRGALELLYGLERSLSEIAGMAETTLQPLAGAHGETTGTMIMAAYHRGKGNHKKHIIVPDSSHGTNPASAAFAGFDVVTIPSNEKGVMDLDAFRAAVNDETAGLMLTCPNTMGVFNPHIEELAGIIHGVDGLMYYDGANLNAIMGRYKPGEMGFDLCHLNLHKTFSTPHGGGGPGAGPVGVSERLRPYLPISRVVRRGDGSYALDYDQPKSIGYIAPFYGNFGVLARAYAYILMLGGAGLKEVSEMAVLNANYIQEGLRPLDYAYAASTEGRCMHECVFSAKPLGQYGVHAADIAKGLLDRGMHAPTMYFPLNVDEALMIEPTETETRETLDHFIAVMRELAETARDNPEALHAMPKETPVGRIDEVKAAKDMILSAPQ